MFKEFVLPQWLAWQQQGHRCVLATLLAIHGSAPRPPGAQMAITEDGQFVGYISGGCVEKAIISEAQAALAKGRNTTITFGPDSPYMDLQLPCGSSIVVGLEVDFSVGLAQDIVARIEQRRPVRVGFGEHPAASLMSDWPAEAKPPVLVHTYMPPVLIRLVGAGPIVPILARLAIESGCQVAVYSPDTGTLEGVAEGCFRQELMDQRLPTDLPIDNRMALVTLFHDHDWDAPVLQQALSAHYGYVGALGSRTTQQKRARALQEVGASKQQMQKLSAPAGLFHGGKTPPDIAVSILAEILKVMRENAKTA